MAALYQTYLGSFRSPAATGSQAVTGVGFTPKALFIWSVNTAISTPEFNNFNYWSSGMTDGTNHVAITSITFDNNATSDESQGIRTDSLILAEDTNGSTQHRATFTSFDSGGFTINWTNIFSSEQRYYNFIAIGGSDVEVEVGEFNSNTATGSQAFAGLAFTPTGVIFQPIQNAGTSEDTLTYPAVGFTDGTNQGASYVWSEDNAAVANTSRYQRTNKCVALGNVTTGAVLAEAGITSFNSDGFTLDWTTAPASAIRVFYLAFTGIPFKVGSFTQPAASGSQSITGVGFKPGAVLLQSVNGVASTSVVDENDFSLGGASASLSRSMWMADNDGADPTEASRYYSHSLIYAAGVVAATASALACSASLTSMDTNGFTLSHTADGTQRQILYAAFAIQLSAGSGSESDSGTSVIAASRQLRKRTIQPTYLSEIAAGTTYGHVVLKELDELCLQVNQTFTELEGSFADLEAVVDAVSARVEPSVVVQVVSTETGAVATGTTTVPTDDTIPQIGEGTEFMTLAITPTSAVNRLHIEVVFVGSCGTASRTMVVGLFQDATNNALAAGIQSILSNQAGFINTTVFDHDMVAGTVSSTTFRVRAGVETSGTVTFNGASGNRFFGGVLASSITITEYIP